MTHVQAQGGRPDHAPRKRRGGGDDGVALVEFAIIMPLLFMLLLGMFTGGLAYSRSISMNNAAREGARYGASLPITGTAQDWLRDVAEAAQDAASGDLDEGVEGHYICVAYVHPDAEAGEQATQRIVVQGVTEAFDGSPCPGVTDSRPASEARVQVEVRRESTLEALVFSRVLTLERQSIARYER